MSIGEIRWEKWTDPYFLKKESSGENEDELAGVGKHSFLLGPEGALPINEKSCVSHYYNFWVAHTNFKITNDDCKKIKDVNGVESLNAPSRHRFRIAIGKAFDEHLVKRGVESLFIQKNEPPKRRTVVDILSENLASKWEHWAVVQDDVGRLSSVCSHELTDFNKRLEGLTGKVVSQWA